METVQKPNSRKHATSRWVEKRVSAMEDITRLNPTDRLSFYSAIIRINKAISESVQGWEAWLRNPVFMEEFSVEELKEIFEPFKGVCLKFIEEDIKWTEKKQGEVGKERSSESLEAERLYT